MEAIAAEAVRRHGCLRAAVLHRTGRVEIGEASVAIAVSAAHRHAAITACTEIIDTLKQRVPIWKKERYTGGEEWIGQGS
jgi:molybdopterin synthase catalytic subunit